MTRTLEPVVPPALRDVLDREDLGAGDGFTMLLLSVRDDEWPHVTMLSVGEVVALDERRLRLALWPASTGAANLASRGRATLTAVLTPNSYVVRASVRALGELETPIAGRRAAFEATVHEAGVDTAPYAVLEAGVRFRLKDRDATLPGWAEVRRALREAAP